MGAPGRFCVAAATGRLGQAGQRPELVLAALVLRRALVWRRGLRVFPLDDVCEVWRMRLSRSSGNSEARAFAWFMTPLAWRVNEPLVASA